MLELYVSEVCPYCHKVEKYLSDNNIEYTERDIAGQENMEKLLQLGGKMQVPFFHDTEKNVTMYESDDIVKYVKENYAA